MPCAHFIVNKLFYTFSSRISQSYSNKLFKIFPANIYLFKDNNGNTGKMCEIYSKLSIKTLERRHWRLSGVFIVDFEHISHIFSVFLSLTLNK